MKKIFFLIIAINSLFGVSAFEAGDLDSPNPYGLTKDEKYILKNKTDIQHLKNLIKSQQDTIKEQDKSLKRLKLQFLNYKMKMDTISQKLDGMSTIFPSFEKYNQEIISLKEDLNATNTIVFSLKDQINQLQTNIESNDKLDKENMKIVIGLVEQLAKRLDSMNRKVIKRLSDFRTLPKDVIFSRAVSELKSRHFNRANAMFDYLYKHNYQPAKSLFYLGEVAYRIGQYSTALSYYKKAVKNGLKDDKLTPSLLYHTGYSFEKLNQPGIAKKSYLKLLKDYPNSIFVTYAKKRLQNLENDK